MNKPFPLPVLSPVLRLGLLVATLLTPASLTAQTTYTWSQATGGSHLWATDGNWLGGVAPSPVSGDTVDFSTLNIAGNIDVTLGADRTAEIWKFGDTSGTQQWTVNAGNQIILAGTTPAIDVANNTTTINGEVGGSSGMTKSGAGILILNGANTYTGDTTITGGILDVDAISKGPLSSGALFLRSGGYLRIVSTNVSSVHPVTVGAGGGSISVNGNNNFTTTGRLSGADPLTFFMVGGAGGRQLRFNATDNDFTGELIIGGGSSLEFSFNSLVDSANRIVFNNINSNGAGTFSLGSGAIAPLTLNNRALEFNSAATGTASLALWNQNTSQDLAINTDLIATGAGIKQIKLLSSNSGRNNVFGGSISDGTGGGTVGVWQDTGGASWTLSGTNNTYSGDTLIDDTLTLRGTGAVSTNTTFRLGGIDGSAGNNDTVRIRTDDAGTVHFGNRFDLRSVQTSAAAQWTIDVGNNGGATAGSTLVFGKLNFAFTTDYRAPTLTINTVGANGYRVQVGDVDLSYGSANRFNPTTAPLTITGTVKQINGKTVNGAGNVKATADTLLLDGTAAGNRISGPIRDALDFTDLSNPNAQPLGVFKQGAGEWILSGTNTYTGVTTVTNGILRVNGNQSAATNTVSVGAGTLGGAGTIGGAVTVGAAGSLAPGAADAVTGTLHLAGGLDVTAPASGGAGKLRFDLSIPAASDRIAVSGTLTIGTEVLGFTDFAFTNLETAPAGVYKLITSGGVSGSLNPLDLGATIGAVTATLRITGGDVELVLNGGTSGDYATWIGGYDVGAQTGFGDDPDGDGNANGIEYVLGTDPGALTLSLRADAADGNTFTFSHPVNGLPTPDATVLYRWSRDMQAFLADGATDGQGTMVSFTPGAPSGGRVTVVATVTGPALSRLYVRMGASQP